MVRRRRLAVKSRSAWTPPGDCRIGCRARSAAAGASDMFVIAVLSLLSHGVVTSMSAGNEPPGVVVRAHSSGRTRASRTAFAIAIERRACDPFATGAPQPRVMCVTSLMRTVQERPGATALLLLCLNACGGRAPAPPPAGNGSGAAEQFVTGSRASRLDATGVHRAGSSPHSVTRYTWMGFAKHCKGRTARQTSIRKGSTAAPRPCHE